jgi:hypothetical protein
MNIRKHSYDKNYPYIISNGWGQEMSCSRADLIELKKEIDRVLDNPHSPHGTVGVCRVPPNGSIGGLMVRRMIEQYEKNVNERGK